MHLIRSIKKRLISANVARVNELKRFRSECETRNDKSSVYRYVVDELRYLRWNRFIGNDLLRRWRIFPLPYDRVPFGIPGFVADADGIDLSKDYHEDGETVNIFGLRLPRPSAEEQSTFHVELNDVVLPSLLRRRIDDFDAKYERIYGLFDVKGRAEGPYELGDRVVIEKGDVVLDCGANMGLFSAVASHFGGEVHAFEPLQHVIERYLSVTASLNPPIKIWNSATWDSEGKIEIELDNDNIGGSTCVQERYHGKRTKISVDTTTLDRFVEQNHLDRVDFIKADIEGAERNMLRGASNVLRRFAPKLSICTYHLPDDPEVLKQIILEANPKYHIIEKFQKLYAYVP